MCRGVPITITYTAWNSYTKSGQTGDANNHTLRWIKDGVETIPTNRPVEVNPVTCPGQYNLLLTSAETNCLRGVLAGVSSTEYVSIIPVPILFLPIPNAAAGTQGGLPIIGAPPLTKLDQLQFTTDNRVLASVENLGAGAYSVIFRVKNTNNKPLARAYVRLRQSGAVYCGWTSDTGQIQFSLDAGTYIVLVQKSGYESYSGILEVTDDIEQTIILNPLTIPASDPGFITVYSYCYTKDGDPEPGVEISCQIVYVPGHGKIMNPSIRSAVSNATGLVVFDNLIPGARYKFKRNTAAEWIPVTIPPTASSPYELISFVS